MLTNRRTGDVLSWYLLTDSNYRRRVHVALTRICSWATWRWIWSTSMWSSRYITSKSEWSISIRKNQQLAISYPRAKIGVSGKLHEVCNRLSSRGLCADRLGKPLLMRRLRDDVLDGKSGGRVRPGDRGDDIGIDPFLSWFLYDLLKPASIERVFSVFNDGAWGGIAGARCSFL